jgi:coenzyme F420-reducing hydrogenase beta subunit
MPCNEPDLLPSTLARAGMCIGCGACVQDGRARMKLDHYGQYQPAGPKIWERDVSTRMLKICPFSPQAVDEDELGTMLFPTAVDHHPAVGRYLKNYVGHAASDDLRAVGSSGGLVTWTCLELLRRGLVDGVVHVKPRRHGDANEPLFRYAISRSEAAVREGAGSRYYPIELSGVLREMAAKPGRYVVVGIPCFIKAVQLARLNDPVLRDRIVITIGLVCGHMKSARFAESIAWQAGQSIENVEHVDFRVKTPGRPANWYRAGLLLSDGSRCEKDWWDMVDGDWGAGFFQASACNYCDDVCAETADVSFGDAWIEPYSSQAKGTNVVVVRSSLIHDLLLKAKDAALIRLEEVDACVVERTQAAGLRQRREGLALRLAWHRGTLLPRKRMWPRSADLPVKRVLIYRLRRAVARWSHVVFDLSRRSGARCLYLRWASTALALYQALSYGRGALGRILGDPGRRGNGD